MKTKFIFSNREAEIEHWTELPFCPHIGECVNAVDILSKDQIVQLYQSAMCWSTSRGTVNLIEYRRNDAEYFAEITVWCED